MPHRGNAILGVGPVSRIGPGPAAQNTSSHGCGCYRAVVVQARWGGMFRHWHDGGSPKAPPSGHRDRLEMSGKTTVCAPPCSKGTVTCLLRKPQKMKANNIKSRDNIIKLNIPLYFFSALLRTLPMIKSSDFKLFLIPALFPLLFCYIPDTIT